MDVKINIHWSGTAPGLAQHRLSIGAFAKALEQLLATYQRIASGLINNALDDPGYGVLGGRFAKEAKHLDLEIGSISEGSLGLQVSCTSKFPGNLDLFEDLPERAADQLLEFIDAEARGAPRHVGARKYLASLPPGITAQKYSLYSGSILKREVNLGDIDLPEFPQDVPHLEMVLGHIVGVGFEPGKPEVRLKVSEPSKTFGAAATDEWVQRALGARGIEVDALLMVGEKTRLLWFKPASTEWRPPTPEQRSELIFRQWDELLGRLAR